MNWIISHLGAVTEQRWTEHNTATMFELYSGKKSGLQF